MDAESGLYWLFVQSMEIHLPYKYVQQICFLLSLL